MITMDSVSKFANLADLDPEKLNKLGTVWAAVLALPHTVNAYAMIMTAKSLDHRS